VTVQALPVVALKLIVCLFCSHPKYLLAIK
jgi:hypothetical protein